MDVLEESCIPSCTELTLCCLDIVANVNVFQLRHSVYFIYRKIPKISPGAYIFQRSFLRGLYTEGNLRFKIDCASLIVGRKFTVFFFLYFVFEGNFPSTSSRGAYIWGAI